MRTKFIKDTHGLYAVNEMVSADDIVQKALHIMSQRNKRGSDPLSSPQHVKDFLRLNLGSEPAEHFAVVFLDNRHRVISYDVLFHGTVDSAAVYPREVIRKCLEHNAAALILAHNHPSGVCEPSDADVRLTRKLVDACSMIDVRILDHIIVSSDRSTSLAERGLM